MMPLLLLATMAAAAVSDGNTTSGSIWSAPEQMLVGMNLPPLTTDGWGVSEWSETSTRIFRDLFQHSTPFVLERAPFNTEGVKIGDWVRYGLEQVEFNLSTGYPLHLPRRVEYNAEQRHSAVSYIGRGGAHLPSGLYAAHFDGNGSLSFGDDAREIGYDYDDAAQRGRYLLNITASTGMWVRITATDAASPLHRIRIFSVDDEVVSSGDGAVDVSATDEAVAAQPFHASLLRALQGAAVLRFCGWARIDSNGYNENNFLPAWEGRALVTDQTQAGLRGVALEHMVSLANALNASAWFCMPRTDTMTAVTPREQGRATCADIAQYASFAHARLHAHLSMLVEYRDKAAGSLSQENAIESLEIWRCWSDGIDGADGGGDGGDGGDAGDGGGGGGDGGGAGATAAMGRRVVRVVSEGPWLSGTLEKFGSDVTQVDAVAVAATFGTLCPYGTRAQGCVNFDTAAQRAHVPGAPDAATFYADADTDTLLDTLHEAALHAESTLNARVQILHEKGIPLLSYTGGPDVGAAGYGHRATLDGAKRCRACHRTVRGNKYGTLEFAAEIGVVVENYVVARQWAQMDAYEGLSAQTRAHVFVDSDGAERYWAHVGDETSSCARACDVSAVCAGFAHVRAGEWACGAGSHDDCPGDGECFARDGSCAVPGTCYFFNANTYSEWSTNTVSDASRLRDVYWKASGDGASPFLKSDGEAAAECAGSCQFFYTMGDDADPQLWTLDALATNWSDFVSYASLEQNLEHKLIAAGEHPRMFDVFLDFLDRWRRIGGALFVSQPLYRPPSLCTGGGKGCGHRALSLGPRDAEAPKLRAVQAYASGARSSLPLSEEEAATAGLLPILPACVPACVWGSCLAGRCVCYEGASGSACATLGAPRANDCTDASVPLGLNLGGIHDWSREWVFVDAFKSARSWCSETASSGYCGDTTSLDVDEKIGGYPARLAPVQRACTIMLRDVETHWPSGTYVVLYSGDGVLTFGLDSDYVKRVRSGRIEVEVGLSTGSNNGLRLCIERTNPENPIRNVRVMVPGYERSADLQTAEPEFHPAFVNALRRYRVLRFMDWAAANEERGGAGEWEERARDGGKHHSYAVGPGVPYESMLKLCNMLGAAPWLTLPYNASDDFVRNLARMLNTTLRPDVEIYVSLSNEMWHSGFAGGQHAERMGHATGLGRHCWYVTRTQQLAAAMSPLLTQRHERIHFVVESQFANVDATRVVLECVADFIETSEITDVGIAPYFDGYDPSLPDLEAVLTSYDLALNTTLERVVEHASLVAAANLSLLTYEAGPGGAGNGTASDLAIAAHRHANMGAMVERYYDGLRAAGLTALVHFSSAGKPSKYGSWGLVESTDQDPATAPKLQGIMAHADKHGACDVDTATAASSLSSCAECSDHGHCLPESLRWGDRETDACSCYFAYSGPNCSHFEPVVYQSCGYHCTFDQGVCEVTGIFGPNVYSECARCHPQHFGATCSLFSCANDCHGHGHCLDADVCSCYRGFTGPECEVDCGCSGHGQCGANNECVCDVGWRSINGACEWACETADEPGVGCVGPGQNGCASCEHGTCVDGVCRCWAGFEGEACAEESAGPRPNAHSIFGINLASPGGTNWVFVDLMKEARAWTSVNDKDRHAAQFSYQDGANSLVFTNRQYTWGNGLAVETDAHGYPSSLQEGQALITLAARDVCKHAVEGRYVVLYDGDGDIDFGMDASAVAFQHGRVDVDFTPTCKRECWFDRKEWEPYCSDNGIAISVRRSSPLDPLRNVRIIAPGFLATHARLPFHPLFTRSLTSYSTLRFMDWAHTNRVPKSVIRPIEGVEALRLRVVSLRDAGENCALIGDVFIFARGNPVTVSNASAVGDGTPLPAILDGSAWSDACVGPDGEGGWSMELQLTSASDVDSYAWRTGGGHSGRDPVRWRLEGRVRGAWSVLDEKSLFDQPTTLARRRGAVEQMLTSSNFEVRGISSDYLVQAATRNLEWADRPLPSHRSQAEDGVAMEYMLQLSNSLGAAPWLCVHHLATDAYVREMATVVRDSLRSDVPIYVEHSNEVWNGLFPQGQHSRAQGLALGLQVGADGAQNACAGWASEAHCAALRYNTKRSLEIFAIWTQVFGEVERGRRLRFVISTQTGGPVQGTHELLSYLEAAGKVDLLGISGYMSPAEVVDGSYSALNAEAVHARMEAGAAAAATTMRLHAEAAAQRGVATVVYEGGPALVQDGVIGGGDANGDVTELLISANRHPRMEEVVSSFFDAFNSTAVEVGGQQRSLLGDSARPFMYFAGPSSVFSKYGSWGMREFTDQPAEQAPKYRAVMRAAAAATAAATTAATAAATTAAATTATTAAATTTATTAATTAAATAAATTAATTAAAATAAATAACVHASELRAAVGLGDTFSTLDDSLSQRFSGFPAVSSPRLNDKLVLGQRYAISWDAARANASETVAVELWQHDDCDGANLIANLGYVRNTGSLSLALDDDTSVVAGDDYFVRVVASHRQSANYSEPFSVVSAADAPPAFALYIERDVDLLSAYHRDCDKGRGWAIVEHFRVDSCVYDSAEGCRAYRTARARDYKRGVDAPLLHGNFKPVRDCVLHVVGVRATMQLEGLTRGFDTAASDSIAKVIATEAQVAAATVKFVNVRTVAGFATYVVGDCRQVSCGPDGRRRRLQTAPADSTAYEFDIVISTNDEKAGNVLTVLGDIGSAGNSSYGDFVAQQVARTLTKATNESFYIAVQLTNMTTTEGDDGVADSMPPLVPPSPPQVHGPEEEERSPTGWLCVRTPGGWRHCARPERAQQPHFCAASDAVASPCREDA